MTSSLREKTSLSSDLMPEIEQFLEEMSKASQPYSCLMSMPVTEARKIAETVRKTFTSGGPSMTTISNHHLNLPSGSVKIRVYSPATDKTLPCMFYIHGGGWVLFSLDTHDRLMREYAAGANMRVIGIEYSLAPENKYPTQIHEITDALKWCFENADELGIDRERIAIGGDSAGANLSVATCLNLKEQGLSHYVSAAVLNYGVFDGRCDTKSYKQFGNGEYLLSAEEMGWFWASYLNNSSEAISPLTSPIFADVKGLPPAFMVIADHDVLHDENIHMKTHFDAAGVTVKATVYKGTTHSFLEATSFGGVACEAIKDTTDWLKSLWVKSKQYS